MSAAWRRRAWLLGISYVALLSYNGGIVLLPFHVGGHPRALPAPPLRACAGPALRTGDHGGRHGARAHGESVHGRARLDVALLRAPRRRDGARHEAPLRRPGDRRVPRLPRERVLRAPRVALCSRRRSRIARRLRRRAPRHVGRDAIVLAGMALAGVVLTAQAMRTREYSVPIAFALFAVLAPRRAPVAPRRGDRVASCSSAALVLPRRRDAPARSRSTSHEPVPRRAPAPRGERRSPHPEHRRGRLLHAPLGVPARRLRAGAQSRYFIYPYPDLFHDVWELHDHAELFARDAPHPAPLLGPGRAPRGGAPSTNG